MCKGETTVDLFMRPGRITAALGIIALGLALLMDQLQATNFAGWILDLWPLIFIGVGIELVLFGRARHYGIDWGALILLVIIGIITRGVASDWIGRPWGNMPFRISIPGVTEWGPASYQAETVREFGDIREIELDGGSESIAIVRAAGGQVRVTLAAVGRGRDEERARRQAEALRLDTATSGSQLSVDVTWTINNPAVQDVRLTLEVPDGVRVIDTDTGSGSIRIEGVLAEIKLDGGSGRVEVLGVGGSVSGGLGSGGAELSAVGGSIEVSGGSGSIDIRDPRGDVRASAGSGTVTLSTDRVDGHYDLEAGSGSVRLELPRDAGVQVDAEVGSGSISGPSWLQVRDDRATGQVGDGTYRIRVRTGSGSIRVSER